MDEIAFRRLMKIGVPKEITPGENRVALVPEVVGKMTGKGHEVIVQRGAGAGALLPDSQFEQAGAKVVDDPGAVWQADVVAKVAPPTAEEIKLLGPGST